MKNAPLSGYTAVQGAVWSRSVTRNFLKRRGRGAHQQAGCLIPKITYFSSYPLQAFFSKRSAQVFFGLPMATVLSVALSRRSA